MLFDTHAHMDDRAFDADREALLSALPEQGIGLLMNPRMQSRVLPGGLRSG